jgi:hypothetical protein
MIQIGAYLDCVKLAKILSHTTVKTKGIHPLNIQF